jgi:hypothetical protein
MSDPKEFIRFIALGGLSGIALSLCLTIFCCLKRKKLSFLPPIFLALFIFVIHDILPTFTDKTINSIVLDQAKIVQQLEISSDTKQFHNSL